MTAGMHPRALVAGIGNIFLGDDGFGGEVARALQQRGLPAHTQVIDYGIRGLDLAYALLEPYAAIILVDAIARGEAPGTVYVLRAATAETVEPGAFDPHSMQPAALIAMARRLGEITAPIFVVGCEPLDFGEVLEGRMGLSVPVMRAVPEAVRAVLQLVQQQAAVSSGAAFALQEGVLPSQGGRV